MKTRITSFFLFVFFVAINELSGQVAGNLQTSEINIQFIGYEEFVRVELQYNVSSKNHVTTQNRYGEPELPVIQKKYLLPLDATQIGVQPTGTSKQALSGTYYIYPEQPPIPLDGGDSPDWVLPKPEIYQSDEPYPGKVIEIDNEGSTMGYKIITVNLYPISYLPLSQTLELYSSVEFELQYNTGSGNVVRPEKISSFRNTLVTDFIKSTVSNPDDID